MSYESHAIGNALSTLSDERVSPRLIDTAHQVGAITEGMLVMTSLGTVSRAIATPYYETIQFNNSIFDRFAAAADNGYPFVEATVRVTGEDVAQPTAAQVIVRFCSAPYEEGVSTVLQAGCTYSLSDTHKYGTYSSVVKEVYRRRDWGVLVPSLTGLVDVSPSAKHKKTGKWQLKSATDASSVVRTIHHGVSNASFVHAGDLIQ